MMKIAFRVTFFLLIGMFLFGCGNKTAGVEGKIIDGQGKPVSGVSVLFKQVQPVQGYEQFETKAGADGSFHLTGIAPSSDYIMTLLSGKWSTKITLKIKTPDGGKNLALGTPIKIRFNQMKDGTVIDTRTGLQWLIYPAAEITASTVINTVKSLRAAGFTDWRLPSGKELADLQENPATASKTCCVWITEANSAVVDWNFYGVENNELWTSRKDSPDNRIVVVRNITALPVAAPVSPAVKP